MSKDNRFRTFHTFSDQTKDLQQDLDNLHTIKRIQNLNLKNVPNSQEFGRML